MVQMDVSEHVAQPPASRRRFSPFAARTDREHEMVINRLVFGGLIFGYLANTTGNELYNLNKLLGISIFYLLGGLFFFLLIIFFKRPSPLRRVLAMMLDLGTLSFGLHVGGEITAILYPMYLWIIFGNGFRFGVAYLFVAQAIGLLGFLIVCLTDNYWSSHPPLAFGLVAGLVVIPTYTSTLIRKLSHAKQQAEQASKQKSLFLASVSHELRTPLNAVIGLSEILQTTKLDADQQEMTHTIRSSGQALLDHINDILQFSRFEAGQMPCELVRFDLHEMLSEVAAMVRAQAFNKPLDVNLQISACVPGPVLGDRKHLHEILVNLAGNAVKFTDSGYVLINVRLEESEAAGLILRFDVSDSGIGVAEDARERIFESFTQADETIINSFGGTGLGLAIAKQLVMLNGGRIGVESELGVGSNFWFDFRVEIDRSDMEGHPVPSSFDLNPVLVSAAPDAADLVAQLETLGAMPRLVHDLKAARLLDDPGDAVGRPGVPLMFDMRGMPGPVDVQVMDELLALRREKRSLILIDNRSVVRPPPELYPFQTVMPWLPQKGELDNVWRIALLPDLMQLRKRKISLEKALAQQEIPSLRVLVAEDNRTNQKVIRRILEGAGQQVRIVDDGRLALEVLSAEPFDIVLMDLNMPRMSGIEAARLYRESVPAALRVPIIALTADATLVTQAACEAAGMAACATKPIQPELLFALIRRHALGDHEKKHILSDDDHEPEGQGGLEEGGLAEDGFAEGACELEPIGRDRETRSPGAALASASEPSTRAAPAVVDHATLARLRQLGGADFCFDVTKTFLLDGAEILQELRRAVHEEDDEAFRDLVHALRSSAANVGAFVIYEICLQLRDVDRDDLLLQGQEHVEQIARNFERVRDALGELDDAA